MIRLISHVCTVVLLSAPIVQAQPQFPTRPEQAKVMFTDIARFLEVYRSLGADSDTVAALKQGYFAGGSPGLQEYVKRHQLTAEGIAQAMQEKPEHYAQLADFYENREEVAAAFRRVLERYDSVLPRPMYPPTYLLVGDFRGVAQASAVGQLVTVETAAARRESLLDVMTHELTHFQQAKTQGFQRYVGLYAQPDNMLGIVLREGGAEFVTFDLVRKRPYGQYRLFEGREAALWQRFQRDLQEQDTSFWLWNKDEEGRSVSLGYTMGYLICRAYYTQASDKAQALMDILEMKNPEAFLAQSGYSPSDDD